MVRSKDAYNNLRGLILIPVQQRFPAGHALRRAQLAYRLAVDRALLPAGVTAPQFQALALVEAEPGISSAQLARRSGVTAQTVKDIVRNLERAGLIARDSHPEHGRILTLMLTEKGRTVLERCEGLVDGVERRMLAPFSEPERAALVDALLRAGDALLLPRRPGT